MRRKLRSQRIRIVGRKFDGLRSSFLILPEAVVSGNNTVNLPQHYHYIGDDDSKFSFAACASPVEKGSTIMCIAFECTDDCVKRAKLSG